MIKLGYVSHCPGHRNSEGESAPWCIRQHNTDKILESFKSEEAAKEGLRNMESHKGSVEKICKDCGKEIPELEAFPGPRCLDCHAKWFDSIPLSQHGKPDFVRAIKSSIPRSEYPGYARELIAMFGKDPADWPSDWQSPAQDYAAAAGIDAEYLYDAVLKELERRQTSSRFTASFLQRKARMRTS